MDVQLGARVVMQGAVYEVLAYQTRAEIEAKYPLTARELDSGVIGQALLRKPKGIKEYLADDLGPAREEIGWSRFLPVARLSGRSI